jgi:hypothetical protein
MSNIYSQWEMLNELRAECESARRRHALLRSQDRIRNASLG